MSSNHSLIFLLDKEIVTILTQISVAKREAEIKLDETDFYEKKMIYKRKKLILEELKGEQSGDDSQGCQPGDEVDIDKEYKRERRKSKKKRKTKVTDKLFFHHSL